MEVSRQSNAVTYAETATGTRTLHTLQSADRYNRWLLDRVPGAVGSRLLEIGCGSGTMTRLLSERELFVGIDVVDDFVTTLARRYADRPEVNFLRHDISTSIGHLDQFRFDSAVSFNVFEHIEDDVAALRNVYRVLGPGGRLGLVVPAHEFLRGRFDDLIGHWRRYSARELGRKLESAGFAVQRLAYSNPVGALGWLVQVKALGRTELSATGAFDRMVRALAAIERHVSPLFGLSVVAVARKPR